MDPGLRREAVVVMLPPNSICQLHMIDRKMEDAMQAVIFEVEPAPGRQQDYLDLAARLRPELEKIDGFVSIERFQSLTNPGKILSLSFWRDEEAVERWRRQEQHQAAQ